MKLRLRRRQIWTIAIGVAAVILALLLALIATGNLVLPGTTPASVNVSEVHFRILQGTNASGNPWFGPSEFNYTGIVNGYPFTVAPGASFTAPVNLLNFDSSPHTLYSIQVATPFTFVKSSPTLPATVASYTGESVIVFITIQAPSSPGATLALYVTINALGP